MRLILVVRVGRDVIRQIVFRLSMRPISTQMIRQLILREQKPSVEVRLVKKIRLFGLPVPTILDVS